ncbi:histone-lysine N-methyltransferase SETD1A-like [Schistocerca gregaria]|uniref:histone-lysine N-methyltransferase SETD1A-like n=1 Tax=Schistocerca gregaria TaxID=7010 RepID=UPI00211EC679|nr:histone-lysine N-methyltransferase SETD1A-like [Schistocerca gregaria]
MKRGPGESRIPLFRAAAAPRQAFAAPAPAEPVAVEAHLPHLQQRPRAPQELAEAALRQAGQLPSVPGKAGLSLHSPPRAAGAGGGDSGADVDGAEAPAAPKAHKGAGRVATIFGALRKLAPQAGGGKREEPAPPAETAMPGDGDAWQRFVAPQLPRPARPIGAAPAAPAPAFARSALRKGGEQPRGAAPPLPRSASATTKLHERHGDTYTVASGRQTAATLALYRGVADDDPAPTPAACGAVQEVTTNPEEHFQNAAAAGAAYRKRPSLLGLFGGAAPASGGVAVAVASTSSGTTSPVGSGQKARKGSGGRWQPLYSSTPFRPPPDAGTGSEAATPEDERLRVRAARCAAAAPRAVARGRLEQEEPCHVARTRQEQEESGGGGGGGGGSSSTSSHNSSSGGGAGQRPRYLEHRAGYTFTIPSEPSPLTKYEGRHSSADLGDFKQRQWDSQPAPAPVLGIEDTEEMDVDNDDDDDENSVDLSSEQAEEPSSGAGGGGGGGGGGLANRQGSLELDESLGILTPDQMKEPFSLLGDSAATFLCGSAPAPWAGGENSVLRMDALCREVVYVDQFSFPEYDSIMDTVEEGGRAARAAASPLPPASPCSGAASASAAGDGDATEQTLSPEELPVDTPVREQAALLEDDDTKTEDASDATTLLTASSSAEPSSRSSVAVPPPPAAAPQQGLAAPAPGATHAAHCFVTSVTSITSLDTGYQGDGESSRPASRGAELSSPPGPPPKAQVAAAAGHGLALAQPQDPMTDSDFFTESDADGHEEARAPPPTAAPAALEEPPSSSSSSAAASCGDRRAQLYFYLVVYLMHVQSLGRNV